MKYAVKATAFLSDAVENLLFDAGFDQGGTEFTGAYILVNTAKSTFKYSDDAKGRTILDPATSWAAVAALVDDNAGGSQAPAFAYAIGDQVTMANKAKTKPTLILTPNYVYVVDRVKHNSKGQEIIGFAGLPTNEYLASRATKVTANTVATPAPVVPVDANGNTLAIGHAVLVVQPVGKRPKTPGLPANTFSLRTNGVAVIERITAKGALGFSFDAENEFLSKRFVKVSLAPATGIQTGDLVVATPRRDGRFALPENTAIVVRGLSHTKGNAILEGFNEDTYALKRLQKVTVVG